MKDINDFEYYHDDEFLQSNEVYKNICKRLSNMSTPNNLREMLNLQVSEIKNETTCPDGIDAKLLSIFTLIDEDEVLNKPMLSKCEIRDMCYSYIHNLITNEIPFEMIDDRVRRKFCNIDSKLLDDILIDLHNLKNDLV